MSEIPKHCKFCGQSLLWNFIPTSYNEKTGKAEQMAWLSCPDYLGGEILSPPDAMIAYWADKFYTKTEKWGFKTINWLYSVSKLPRCNNL